MKSMDIPKAHIVVGTILREKKEGRKRERKEQEWVGICLADVCVNDIVSPRLS